MPESLQGEKCDDTATKANQFLNNDINAPNSIVTYFEIY